MVTIINNAIDILWLLAGLIAIIVILAILLPWGFFYEWFAVTIVIIWIALRFWLREGWYGIKRLFKKKHKFEDINDPHSFI
jgi:hypothetical protein